MRYLFDTDHLSILQRRTGISYENLSAQVVQHPLCFQRLLTRRVRGSTMDLRIASIALSQDLVLLTRNTKDFEKVPDLKFEDWTIAS